MVRIAFLTEVLSLTACIIIGVITAGCMKTLPIAEADWPTEEMMSRGTMTTFFCGIPIAFFSGLGVAVGLLDSQTNSLVGVAISASLLPPAVNAGMLWITHDPADEPLANEGTLSLALTLMNIGVIIIASMFMFRLKEVRFVLFGNPIVVDVISAIICHPNALTQTLILSYHHELLLQ